MRGLNRRELLAGTAAFAMVAGGVVAARSDQAVLIVGGGAAGAAAALRLGREGRRVTLVERDPKALAPHAGEAFGRASDAPGLDALKAAGVGIAIDDIEGVDWRAGEARALSGRRFGFDRIVFAPGVAARDENIDGLDAVARHHWPAAWGSRAEARRLRAQISALPEAGHVALRLPSGPVSFPAGLDRRVADLRAWLSTHRPAARLTVLDEREGLAVTAVDHRAGRLETSQGRVVADVVNFIPAQRASDAVHLAGLTDASGWAPCDAGQRSTVNAAASILGDAAAGASRTRAAAAAAARSLIV